MKRHRMIVLALLFCLLASPASAVLSPIGAAAPAVTVSASTAMPHFPNTIAFHLDATAPTNEITKVRIAYRPVRYAVSTVLTVPFERGKHVTVDYNSDMQLAWLPPGLDIEYRWLLTLSDGTQFSSEPSTFLYMDEQHSWKKTTSGTVTLWWYSGDDAFGQDAIDTATRTIGSLQKTYSFAGAPPIRIVIYGSARDFHDVNAPNSPAWEGGFNQPRYGIIVVAPSAGQSVRTEIHRLIPHEVTHQMVYEASKNPYNAPPAWLDEGLAVHDEESPNLFFRPILTEAVAKGQVIPLRALGAPFQFTADVQQAYLGYAEAESVVVFIINAYGSKYIGALVSAFRDELSIDQVVQKVLKESIEDLDKEWKASLNYSGDQGGITG